MLHPNVACSAFVRFPAGAHRWCKPQHCRGRRTRRVLRATPHYGVGTARQSWTLKRVAVVGGGVLVFVAADKGVGVCLDCVGSQWPASVLNILLLGAAAAYLPAGAKLERALGPAAAFLRMGLPLFLIPAVLAPTVSEVPSRDCLVKIVGLTVLSALFTVALTGHLHGRLAHAVPAGGALLKSRGAERAEATALRLLGSKKVAAGLALAGGAASGALLTLEELKPAVAMAPGYMGLTAAAYILSPAVTPVRAQLFLPPPLMAAAGIVATAAAISRARHSTSAHPPGLHHLRAEMRRYLDGAGAAFGAMVTPAVSTLGLFTYSHREILLRQWRPLLGTCLIASPLAFLATAVVGRRVLGLSSVEVASVLPATTTTGLALTMPQVVIPPRVSAVAPPLTSLSEHSRPS